MQDTTTLPRPRTPEPGGPTLLRRIFDPGTSTAGPPPLDPRAWTPRHRLLVAGTLLLACVAGLIEAIQTARSAADGAASIAPTEGVRAFLAVCVAGYMVGLALSLRGVSLPGFLAGGMFIAAGIASWTFTGNSGRLVWLVLGAEGVLFAAWVWPWLRSLREAWQLPRLGAAWLGLAYWLIGAAAGVLTLRLGVAVGRLAYFALFALGALAVLVATKRAQRDLTVGIVAAFLIGLAALFVVGSGNAFDNVHAVRDDAWGEHMQYRFWGGPHLLFHPNSIAVAAVVIAIRVAGDQAFQRWQRYSALGLTALLLLLVNSRTGLIFLGAAAGLHLLLVLAKRVRYADRRSTVFAVLLPLVVVGVIAVGSGGSGFLFQSRYSSGGGVTSGRTDTWRQVVTDFRHDTVAEKIFGDAHNVRGYVSRDNSSANPADRPELTTDNAAVGALRRGGILGVAAFLFGLVLMVWHALRRAAPPWFTMAAIGSLVTIVAADWLLGNTGGTLWIFLLAGEAALLFLAPAVREEPPAAD
jgi:hypothetical protein